MNSARVGTMIRILKLQIPMVLVREFRDLMNDNLIVVVHHLVLGRRSTPRRQKDEGDD